MNYDEALKKIHSLLRFGSQPGLERINKFLDKIGNPQDRLKFIHVAGTNGKGSVCAFLSSILKDSGYRTGLFISPYIIDFRERIQVDGQMIKKKELASIVSSLLPALEEMEAQNSFITEFEFVMAVSFVFFKRRKCDIVVLETGLGGTFDCTNVIKTPLASVITSISLDHTEVIGDTITQIAMQKCGIIKKGGITVFRPQEVAVNSIVRARAHEDGNILKFADEVSFKDVDLQPDKTLLTYKNTVLTLPMIGRHQLINLQVALATIEVLMENNRLAASIRSISNGVKNAFLPARMEIVSKKPLIILDGAHNPGGMLVLSKAVKDYLPDKKRIAIIGMLSDKDSRKALSYLSGQFDAILTVTPDNPRALGAEELAKQAAPLTKRVLPFDDPTAAIAQAKKLAGRNGAVVICGSLYLAAQLRPIFVPNSD